MAKVALISDTHWGVRNDNKTFYDYFDKFYFDCFFPYLDNHSIEHCIHLGDITDRRKYINFQTADMLHKQFIKPLMDRNIETHVIIGNHDIYFRNTNEINSMDQLYKDTNLTHLNIHSKPSIIAVDGLEIVMMPWICQENQEDAMKLIKKTKAQVLMGHLELNGFEMHRGAIMDHGMDPKIFKKFDLVCSGHYHHKSTVGNINYLGAPCEYTWSDYDDPRGFHIFDTETRELEYVRNPYSLFRRFNYDDTNKTLEQIMEIDIDSYAGCFVKIVVKNKNNPYWFDVVLEKFEKAGCAQVQVVDDNLNLDLIDDEDIVDEAEDTLTILRKYATQIDANVPTKDLEKFLFGLYQEANSLER